MWRTWNSAWPTISARAPAPPRPRPALHPPPPRPAPPPPPRPPPPRGIALGATEADIRKVYGKPWQARDTRGEHYLRYRSKLKKHPSGAKGLVLVFTLRNGKTRSE